MPRKYIKRYMPDPRKIKEQKCLRFLGTCLHNPHLWHLNRHSVAGAFFIGLLCAYIPIPFQMLLAAVMAIVLHVNIPISVALVWLTNPLTMPPLFYFAYEVGQRILGMPDTEDFHFEPSWQWMSDLFANNWEPFLLGCLVCGLALGLLGYFSIHIIWRSYVSYRWRSRRNKGGSVTDTDTSAGTAAGSHADSVRS